MPRPLRVAVWHSTSSQQELANVGDAAAHRVRVVGTGCQARFLRRNNSGLGSSPREVAARLGPGDELHLQVFCDPKVWDRAFLTITWIASPTRRQWSSRRAYVLRLRDIAEAPNYQGPRVQSELTGGFEERVASEAPADWRLPDRLAPQRQLVRGPQWLGRRLERAWLRRRAR